MIRRILMFALTAPAAPMVAMGVVPDAPATQPAAEVVLRPILSPEQRAEAAREVIDRFIGHLAGAAMFPESAREAVTEAWKGHRADDAPQDFLTAALAMLSERFREGFEALDEADYEKADGAFRALLNAEDPYLSLHAGVLLGHSLVEQDRLDEAEEILAGLVARGDALYEQTFHEPEVDFLLGYAQLSNLRYDAARETLERFKQKHPDAPERFRLPARQMLQELAIRQPESLGEVSDLMTYSGRRLRHGQIGEPVRVSQIRAIELLNKLIEEAEDREQGNCDSDCEGGGGGGGGQGQSGGSAGGAPGAPAEESSLPGGEGRIGELRRSPTARPGEMWGQMPPHERERILQSLRQDFPSQYRQLVEQYYRQLAKER